MLTENGENATTCPVAICSSMTTVIIATTCVFRSVQPVDSHAVLLYTADHMVYSMQCVYIYAVHVFFRLLTLPRCVVACVFV